MRILDLMSPGKGKVRRNWKLIRSEILGSSARKKTDQYFLPSTEYPSFCLIFISLITLPHIRKQAQMDMQLANTIFTRIPLGTHTCILLQYVLFYISRLSSLQPWWISTKIFKAKYLTLKEKVYPKASF